MQQKRITPNPKRSDSPRVAVLTEGEAVLKALVPSARSSCSRPGPWLVQHQIPPYSQSAGRVEGTGHPAPFTPVLPRSCPVHWCSFIHSMSLKALLT